MIPDEAGGLFRAVGDRILRGVDPAVVLRDQRLARRGGATDWVNGVVRFDGFRRGGLGAGVGRCTFARGCAAG
jgi:hypothetical protein